MNTNLELTNNDQNSSIKMNFSNKKELVQKQSLKKSKIVIITTLALLLAIAIVFIIIFIKRQNNRKNKEEIPIGDDKNENSNSNTISNNIIVAKYYLEEGKNITLLDPSLIGLNDDDYFIEISGKEGKLRNLNLISNLTINGKETGILKVNIKLRYNLKSMFGMFKGCENLIDIDLTNLNTSKLENINSLFEGCNNLENVNFFSIKLEKIRETENLFKGCENLIQIENIRH